MPSAILTPGACEQALTLVLPTFDAHLRTTGAFAVPDGELVVVDPTAIWERGRGAEDPAFLDTLLWRHQFGDVANWPFDFGAFARAKAYLSFKYRLPADVVIAQYPYLLEPGFAKYGGSAVDPVGGLVVAFSGAAPHHDKFLSEAMMAALRVVCEERMQGVLADPDIHTLQAVFD